MSRRWRQRLLWTFAAVLILPVVFYLAANAWLESSGGRRLLERELTDRAGMDVKIRGEFDLMLIPSIGVSGTDLVVGGPGADALFASSRKFEVSVALKPLLKRNVQVEWIRLSGGQVHPGRYRPAYDSGEDLPVNLPAIRELTVKDFRFIFSDHENEALLLNEFSVSEFRADRETFFSLAAGRDISARGFLRWESDSGLLHLTRLRLGLGGQFVDGRVCLRFTQPRSFDAVLHAGVFDLDAARHALAGYGRPGAEDGTAGDATDSGWPAGINLALTVDELVTGGTVAKGVEISVGQPVMAVCGSD